eukprot:sb/3478300/
MVFLLQLLHGCFRIITQATEICGEESDCWGILRSCVQTPRCVARQLCCVAKQLCCVARQLRVVAWQQTPRYVAAVVPRTYVVRYGCYRVVGVGSREKAKHT